MEGDLPIRITAYDKNYVRNGVVAAPNAVNTLLVWDAPALTTFELDDSSSKVPALSTEGARCVIERREDSGWVTDMSGPVVDLAGTGSSLDGKRTFAVLGDWDEFNQIVGYPVPGSALSSQGASAYDKRTGPAETVLRDFVSANVAGQGIPNLTVPASSGAGSTITVSVRMHPLSERLFPRVSNAGVGARIVQVGTTRELQTWVPETHARVLTEESGVVVSAEFSRKIPEVTRVIVGCGGEGTARVFKGPFVAAAAEALWGIRRTRFIDARDIETTDPDIDDLAEERADELLIEAGAKASLKAELAETDSFRYGKTFSLGDLVTVKPAGAEPITDRVREVEIDWSVDNGLVITPRIGEWQDSQADSLYRTVSRLLKATNDLGTR